MLLDLVPLLFRARLSLEFAKITIDGFCYALHRVYDMDFPSFEHDCTFFAPTES